MVAQHATRLARYPALLAVLALLVLAGCSGGDDSDDQPETTAAETTATAPSLSRDEIIAEGDAICAEVNGAVSGVMASDAAPATQLSQRTDLYTGMVERLRGLDSEDPDLTSVFSAGRDLVQAASEAETAASAGDSEAAVRAETTVAAALSAFETAASGYGFSECGGEASSAVAPGTGDGTGEDGTVTPEEPATGGETAPETPEPATPEGGAPATGGEDGGTGGGTAPGNEGGGEGGTGGGDGGGGGGDSSSTGGFSPGG